MNRSDSIAAFVWRGVIGVIAGLGLLFPLHSEIAGVKIETRTYSILNVATLPAKVIPYGHSITLETALVAPASEGRLYRPTEIVTNGNSLLVILYYESDGFTWISGHSFRTDLTGLPVGDYAVEVQVRPRHPPAHSDTNFTETFSVVPEIRLALFESLAEIRWTASVTNYVLQRAGKLGPGSDWEALPNAPVRQGSEWFLTNAILGGESYYRLIRR